MRKSGSSKVVWDIDGVARTTGYALLFAGKEAGRIVSYNAKGSHTLMLASYSGTPLQHPNDGEAYRAHIRGGYGFDKFSTAFEKALFEARYVQSKSNGLVCKAHEACREAIKPGQAFNIGLAAYCAEEQLGEWYKTGLAGKGAAEVERFLTWKGYTLIKVL